MMASYLSLVLALALCVTSALARDRYTVDKGFREQEIVPDILAFPPPKWASVWFGSGNDGLKLLPRQVSTLESVGARRRIRQVIFVLALLYKGRHSAPVPTASTARYGP